MFRWCIQQLLRWGHMFEGEGFVITFLALSASFWIPPKLKKSERSFLSSGGSEHFSISLVSNEIFLPVRFIHFRHIFRFILYFFNRKRKHQLKHLFIRPTIMTSPSDTEKALPAEDPGSRLSTISKKYDTSNKGFLNEHEKKMRELDTSNRGYLTNDRVYQMMDEMNQKVSMSLWELLKIWSNRE